MLSNSRKVWAMVGVLFCMGVAAQAQSTNTFNEGVNNYWDTAGNWSLSHKPEDDEHVVIPGGESCLIRNASPEAEAQSIDVQGLLTIDSEAQLTISDDSTVDGQIVMEGTNQADPSSQLIIADDLTITGDGGSIEMNFNSLIKEEGTSGAVLTLEDSCDGELTDECGLTVFGMGTISAELVNGSIVRGELGLAQEAMPLYLEYRPKSGDGIWAAGNVGHLFVAADVVGSARWTLMDVELASKITVHACLNELTGPVDIQAGTLEITQGLFCTSGDLSLMSVLDQSENYTAPEISLADYQSKAYFGGACTFTMCP